MSCLLHREVRAVVRVVPAAGVRSMGAGRGREHGSLCSSCSSSNSVRKHPPDLLPFLPSANISRAFAEPEALKIGLMLAWMNFVFSVILIAIPRE